MRTATYQSLLDRLAAYLGEADGLSVEDAAIANAKINFFARLGWEYFFHPDITPIEKRYFRPPYSAAEDISAGTARYYIPADAYYVALADQSPAAQPPATQTDGNWQPNLAYWAEADPDPHGDDWEDAHNYVLGDKVRNLSDGLIYQCHEAHTSAGSFDASKFGLLAAFVRSIDYDQAGQTPLGDIRYIWDRDPLANTAAQHIRFRLRTDFVQVLGKANVVWLEFRLAVPSWTGPVRSDSSAYTAGQTVFDAATGDFWTATGAVAPAQSPTSNPELWDCVEFPYYLAEFVAQSAYAAMTQREQAEPENFAIQNAAGYPLLAAQIDRIERQQGQTRQLNVISSRNP